MSRLIDADALNIYDISPVDGFAVMGVTEEDINLAPTIDAVEVVLCKDCKWRKACKVFSQQQITDDSYCSWGERKESE